jgi:splicing factor 3A subunit 1
LVEQYTKVLHPSKETLQQLKERTAKGATWAMLEQARRHAKWERTKREREKKRQDDQEAERSMSHVIQRCRIAFLKLSCSCVCGD